MLGVLARRHAEQVPLDAAVEILEVDAVPYRLRVLEAPVVLLGVLEVDLIAVVRPRAELHRAQLLVEGEELNVDSA